MLGSRVVGLTIFITSVSGSKSLIPFVYRFFHFRKSPSLRFAFDAAERNETFDCIQCEIKEQHQRKEKSILLQKGSENQRKSHSNELCENCTMEPFVETEERRKGDS